MADQIGNESNQYKELETISYSQLCRLESMIEMQIEGLNYIDSLLQLDAQYVQQNPDEVLPPLKHHAELVSALSNKREPFEGLLSYINRHKARLEKLDKKQRDANKGKIRAVDAKKKDSNRTAHTTAAELSAATGTPATPSRKQVKANIENIVISLF